VRFTSVRSTTSGIALLLIAATSLAGGDALDLFLDSFEKRYEEARDLRARFVQQSYLASLDREETSSGRLLYLRPGRFRWEIESPEPHVLATDGKALRMFEPNRHVLQIAPLGAGTLSQTALGFLFGEADLRTTFEIEPIDGAERKHRTEPQTRIGLRLRAREESSFQQLEVWIERETLDVRELTILDLLGNRTRLFLEQLQLNVGLEEEAFTIRVPDDTEVIDLR
jgi:outer membrane lipoprotein carrier protein